MLDGRPLKMLREKADPTAGKETAIGSGGADPTGRMVALPIGAESGVELTKARPDV